MLVKWLEIKRRDALHDVQEQFNQAKESYKKQRDEKTGLRDGAAQISELISKADDICDTWVNKAVKIDGLFRSHVYGSLKARLSEILTPAQVETALMRCVYDDSDTLAHLKDEMENLTAEVDRNFQNVILNVKGMKDANAGMEYLKELGFDLTELMEKEKNPITALVAPVETKFLFVGR